MCKVASRWKYIKKEYTSQASRFEQKYSKGKRIGTSQAIDVLRNIQGRSCNHSCSGKVMSITYSECV